MMNKINLIYQKLLTLYGHQGWWPLISHNGVNPTKTGSTKGYHPQAYDFPKTEQEKFEIIIGAVLTQNTSWVQVEKALLNLHALDMITPEKILDADEQILKNVIRPAGYFNQKAQYLKNIARFVQENKDKIPSRSDLLSIKGIGNETCDTILLYAYKQCHFVVDNYTKKIFHSLGLINTSSYDEIKLLFESSLPKDFKIYQELHALIVEHAKRYHSRQDIEDPLRKV